MTFLERYNKWISDQYSIAEKYNKDRPENKKIKVFFRGEPNDYPTKLCPSVYRKKLKDSVIRNIYAEAIAKFYQEFENDKMPFDKLVRMQHYNIPTRLLDVTEDPIVALYFACQNDKNDSKKKKQNGKVYAIFISNEGLIFPSNPLSFIVPRFRTWFVSKNVLSFISLNSEEKEKIKKLDDLGTYKEIIIRNTKQVYLTELLAAKEETYFELLEYDIFNLTGIFCAIPNYTNQRIVRQRSAFILGGLFDEDAKLNSIFNYNDIKYIIDNSEPFNVDAIIDGIKNTRAIEDKNKTLLVDFFEKRKEKGTEYYYSDYLWKAILKEFITDNVKDNLEYIEYLFLFLNLVRRKGKISFYNSFDIYSTQKQTLIDEFVNNRGFTESYLFPDLEHYGNEIKRRYEF